MRWIFKSDGRLRRYLAVGGRIGERRFSTPSCRSMAWSQTPGFLPVPVVRGPLIEPGESTPLRALTLRGGNRSWCPEAVLLLARRDHQADVRSGRSLATSAALLVGPHDRPACPRPTAQ